MFSPAVHKSPIRTSFHPPLFGTVSVTQKRVSHFGLHYETTGISGPEPVGSGVTTPSLSAQPPINQISVIPPKRLSLNRHPLGITNSKIKDRCLHTFPVPHGPKGLVCGGGVAKSAHWKQRSALGKFMRERWLPGPLLTMRRILGSRLPTRMNIYFQPKKKQMTLKSGSFFLGVHDFYF